MSRQLFEARISELKNSKGKNNVMLTRAEYKEIFQSLKKIASDAKYKPDKNHTTELSRHKGFKGIQRT